MKRYGTMNRNDVIEMKSIVRRAMEESLEMYQEQWVTGDVLCQRFQMFSKDWLKRYGKLLPHTQAVVTGADGVKHKTSVCYALNKIQRMVQTGEIKRLSVRDDNVMTEAPVYGGVMVSL